MTRLVEVTVEDARWSALTIEALAERAVRAALLAAKLPASGFEISVLACDDARISRLNADFRSSTAATNVLSWPAFNLSPSKPGTVPAPPPEPDRNAPNNGLGDIAIAYETCQREAEDRDIPLADHAFHLIVHGCLHLLGYDHQEDADATLMEALEIKALASAGIKDPY